MGVAERAGQRPFEAFEEFVGLKIVVQLLPGKVGRPLPAALAADVDGTDGDSFGPLIVRRSGGFAERERDEGAIIEGLPEGVEEVVHAASGGSSSG